MFTAKNAGNQGNPGELKKKHKCTAESDVYTPLYLF